jgi:hypothetical protein
VEPPGTHRSPRFEGRCVGGSRAGRWTVYEAGSGVTCGRSYRSTDHSRGHTSSSRYGATAQTLGARRIVRAHREEPEI